MTHTASLSLTAVAVVLAAIAPSAATPPQQSILQTLPAASFEVASVKRTDAAGVQLGIRPPSPGGRFAAAVTARMLIQVAYGYPVALLGNQIVGGPPWMNDDVFEIAAVADGSLTEVANGPPTRLFAMIRSLLADRFNLRLHAESRQLPIYDLVVARADRRPGPKLLPFTGQCAAFDEINRAQSFDRACGFRRVTPTMVTARGLTLESLAAQLGFQPDVGRPVRDRTGLSERFDVELEYVPFAGGAEPASGVSLFTALREQLGLELKAATGPVDVLVIDRLDVPTPD